MTPIRRATLEDAAHLHALEIECFGDCSWSAGTFRGLFAHEKNWVWVSPCAYLVAAKIGDEAEIERLGVAPHARRHGYAREILSLGLQTLEASGVKRTFLEVREGNRAAQKLYELLGFRRYHVRCGYYDDGENAVLMEKTAL